MGVLAVLVPAFALAFALAWTGVARAATPLPGSVRTVLPTVQVELWPYKQQGLASVIVLGQLPKTASLPATVTLPLIPGSTITWSGEINTADASGDTTLQAVTIAAGGGKAVSVRATKSRLVQYEAVIGRTDVQGDTYRTTMDWFQTVPTGAVTFSSRVPIDAINVVITPALAGDPQTNTEVKQMLYTLEPAQLKPGQHRPFSVVYQLPGGSATGKAAGDGSNAGLAGVVLVLGAVAIFAIGAWAVSRNRAASRAAAQPAEPGADEDTQDGEER